MQHPNLKQSLYCFCIITSIYLPSKAQAGGNATFLGQSQGKTPFEETIAFSINGATLASAYYSILPATGSFTRPIAASFSANYLINQGLLSGGRLYLQVFGLYNNISGQSYNNTVQFAFSYTDGSVSYLNTQVITSGYTSVCPSLIPSGSQNPPSAIGIMHNYRTATSDLGYDYIFLKEYCQNSSHVADGPAILDTDGNIRWIASDNGVATGAAILGSNHKAVYTSNGQTYLSNGNPGIDMIAVNTGLVTPLINFGGLLNGSDNVAGSIIYVGEHNIDPGRNGTIITGANKGIPNGSAPATPTENGSLLIETDGLKLLNHWDFAQIISSAMIAGGDDPAKFVFPTNNDWFHENATLYNPADNTLIVSSRENFIIAVDYDPPADGSVKKIHWIFGDTTKAWHGFSSLSKYALTYNTASAYPPVGQHGISFDPHGNLMMMNDGTPSLVQNPKGIGPFRSFAAKYKIDLTQKTATSPGLATYVYGYGGYGGGSYFQSPYCGSAYDFQVGAADNYLMDFAVEAAAGAAPVFSPTAGPVFAELQGLKNDSSLVFDLQIPSAGSAEIPNECAQGWNAVPVDLSAIQYN